MLLGDLIESTDGIKATTPTYVVGFSLNERHALAAQTVDHSLPASAVLPRGTRLALEALSIGTMEVDGTVELLCGTADLAIPHTWIACACIAEGVGIDYALELVGVRAAVMSWAAWLALLIISNAL